VHQAQLPVPQAQHQVHPLMQLIHKNIGAALGDAITVIRVMAVLMLHHAILILDIVGHTKHGVIMQGEDFRLMIKIIKSFKITQKQSTNLPNILNCMD
jgi:hypothetical protein